MKQLLSAVMALMILLSLCACKKADPTEPATTAVPTSTVSGPIHHHTYRDADCTTPKTCTDCGHTRGNALGHSYTEGVCTRCGETDASYLPLIGPVWSTVSISENGSQLELITLVFTENGCSISAVMYHRLSDVPMDQWSDAMRNEDNWYDYGGEIYYRKQKISAQSLSYTAEGNAITCELLGTDVVLGTLILERTGGALLTVTYFEGDFSVQFLQVGDVFSNEA